jgi:hypothetical protein
MKHDDDVVKRVSGPNDRPTLALALASDAAAEDRAALPAGLARQLRRRAPASRADASTAHRRR